MLTKVWREVNQCWPAGLSPYHPKDPPWTPALPEQKALSISKSFQIYTNMNLAKRQIQIQTCLLLTAARARRALRRSMLLQFYASEFWDFGGIWLMLIMGGIWLLVGDSSFFWIGHLIDVWGHRILSILLKMRFTWWLRVDGLQGQVQRSFSPSAPWSSSSS